jgi:Xaa-Pro aminopeptidase
MLKKMLRDKKIDLLILINDPIQAQFFLKEKIQEYKLVITPREKVAYISSLEFKPKDNYELLTKNWFKKWQSKKVIAIDENKITLKQYQELKNKFKKSKFINFSEELKELRSQKSTKELKLISQAAKITDNAFKALIKEKFSKFKTEKDVADYLEKKIKEQGAELAFPTIVANGENSAIPHHQTTTKELTKGFLLIDFGAKYQDYCADMTRTIYLGTISKEEKKDYLLLLKAQKEALKSIKLGLKFKDLDQKVRSILGSKSSYFFHLLGHGIGLEIHEKPSFFGNEKIKNGQTFTIEPGIYFPKKYGIRIEDTVYYHNGLKVLTKSPKKLIYHKPFK